VLPSNLAMRWTQECTCKRGKGESAKSKSDWRRLSGLRADHGQLFHNPVKEGLPIGELSLGGLRPIAVRRLGRWFHWPCLWLAPWTFVRAREERTHTGWRFVEGVGSVSESMFHKGFRLTHLPLLTYSAENAVPASGLERHDTVGTAWQMDGGQIRRISLVRSKGDAPRVFPATISTAGK
jgi:hypothetical protein